MKQCRSKSPKAIGSIQFERLPVNFVKNTLRWMEFGNFAETPIYSPRISTKSHVEETLDANRYYARRSPAGFLVNDIGDFIIDEKIRKNDMLLVDKKLSSDDGDIVIASVDGELSIKRVAKKRYKFLLVDGNPKYPPIEIKDDNEVRIFGVVTHVIYTWTAWSDQRV